MRDRARLLRANVEYPWTTIFTERIVLPRMTARFVCEMRLWINQRELQTTSRLVRRLTIIRELESSTTENGSANPIYARTWAEFDEFIQYLMPSPGAAPVPLRNVYLSPSRNWCRQLEFLATSTEVWLVPWEAENSDNGPMDTVTEIFTELKETGFAIDDGVLPSLRDF